MIAEARWLNPLTSETKRAKICPLVRIQPADESEPPKTLQSFSGLNWKRWQATGEVTLTIIARDAAKRLSGIEIAFNEKQKKFVPAQNQSELKATATGDLVRNEVIANVFIHEGGRAVPKWRLLICPEKRGRPVRFMFEFPANFGKDPIFTLPEFLQRQFKFDDEGFFTEISPKLLLQSGITSQTVAVHSFRWVNLAVPSSWLLKKSHQDLVNEKDKAIWDSWEKQISKQIKDLFSVQQEKERVLLSVFLEGKVIVRYEAKAKALIEVGGEVDQTVDLVATRNRLEKALANLAPVTLLPSLLQVSKGQDEFLNLQGQWMQQYRNRRETFKKVLRKIAMPLGFVNLQVTTLAEELTFEPKSVENQLRPVMVTLRLKLQGEAWCDHHRQIHVVPVSGKVRFVPSRTKEHLPPIISDYRSRLQKGIPYEPIEFNVPVEGAEVQLPFTWLYPFWEAEVDVEIQVKGWRLILPFKPSVGTAPPKQPLKYTLELRPTQAETAAFLLELPYGAQLRHATIVVQDGQGKIIASQQSRQLDDYGGQGILLTELPYGTYRIAAEGSYIFNGKEQTFSIHQTVLVQSYHAAMWLKVKETNGGI
ncbi:MAG: hypothetical protein NZ805_09940 [Armatimonadetes bacterium]|nr:hypothetical protein [Armatimonadota bacterium]MDW8029115.1 hypothetical protein [Armatimonadota bacterium]